MKPYFDPVCVSSVCGLRKPAKEIYLHAAELAGVKPEISLMSGITLAGRYRRKRGGIRYERYIQHTGKIIEGNRLRRQTVLRTVIFRFRELLEIFPGYPEINRTLYCLKTNEEGVIL